MWIVQIDIIYAQYLEEIVRVYDFAFQWNALLFCLRFSSQSYSLSNT